MKLTEMDQSLRRFERRKGESPEELADYYLASRRSGSDLARVKEQGGDPVNRQTGQLRKYPNAALRARVIANRRLWLLNDIDRDFIEYEAPGISPGATYVSIDFNDGSVHVDEYRDWNEEFEEWDTEFSNRIGELSPESLDFIINPSPVPTLAIEDHFWQELNNLFSRYLATRSD